MTLRSIASAPARSARALTRMVFRRYPFRIFRLPRSKYDYLSEVGDGTGSSTVMAPLLWILRTFPEAPPALWNGVEGDEEQPVKKHEILRLLRRPNEFYTAANLWMATLADWYVDGNAYWLKVRDGAGRVRELWWAPHWMIEPKGDGGTFVTHYEYMPDGQMVLLRKDDVVHFRFGLDGDDPRKGYSPLKSVLREVFTDDEAANFTASLLRNMGVPGLVVSPDSENPPSEEDVKATKEYIKEKFGGDSRGEALVMTGPTKVQQFGFSPEQLILKDLRRIPEERVSAVLGVPAVVAGLGAGLDRSTFTNYAEAREAAYEQTIIPTMRILSEDILFGLVAEYVSDVWDWRFGFDLTNVRVLQEDRDKLARRLDVGVRGAWIKRAEARRAMGLTVDPDVDDVYLIQQSVAEVPAEKGADHRNFTPPKSAAPAAPGA